MMDNKIIILILIIVLIIILLLKDNKELEIVDSNIFYENYDYSYITLNWLEILKSGYQIKKLNNLINEKLNELKSKNELIILISNLIFLLGDLSNSIKLLKDYINGIENENFRNLNTKNILYNKLDKIVSK